MEELRQRIKKLYVENYPDNDRFIPHESLYRVLTKDAIENALNESKSKPEDLDELAGEIVTRARKVFAILLFNNEVHHISCFFEKDHSQPTDIDHKLPFVLEHLKDILPSQSAEDFFHNQWEFAVPVFSGKVITRALHPKIRLPFIRHRFLASGAFGMVYSIEVHPEHWKYEQVSHKQVKQFLPLVSTFKS